MKRLNHLALYTALTFQIAPLFAETAGRFDWPQWQGPQRDAVSQETGLLKEWPVDGPPLAWKITDLGSGYSAPAVAAGRIFGMSNRNEEEFVWALSEKDGKEIWATRFATAQAGGMRQGIEGAGCTPTVDGERLYVIGHGGDLACLQVGDGKIVWQRNLIKDYGGRLPTWRFNESPLIDGDKVVCTPGGIEATMVALNKLTGELIWKGRVPDEAGVLLAPSASAGTDRAPDSGGTEGEGQKAPAPPESVAKPAVVVPVGSRWSYLDTGAFPGADWTKLAFVDDAWSEGPAQLGYGDRDEKTRIDSSSDNYPTYYFRHQFEVKKPGDLKPLVLRLLRDDGAIVYLNGQEVVRDNMPDGKVVQDTFAKSTARSENGFYVHELDAKKLVAGKNIIAVEVHQADAQSSDVSFDLELREKIPGKDVVGAPPLDRRGGSGRGGFGGRGFGRSGAAYASAIAIDLDGQRQYVQFTSKALVGVAASDGKLLWRYDKPTNRSGINCSTPIYHEGQVFAASAYGSGGGLARLSVDEKGGVKAEEIWFSGNMENHHGGMVVVDGSLYGANGGNGGGYLVCLDFKTGEVLWNERDSGKRRARKGSLAYADGRIYYRTEDGPVILIEANRKEYIEHGRFEQPDRTRKPAWSHLVIANGKLYVRDQDLLLCYDVKMPSS